MSGIMAMEGRAEAALALASGAGSMVTRRGAAVEGDDGLAQRARAARRAQAA